MESTDELLYGQGVADRLQAFMKEAWVIEERHRPFFRETPSQYSPAGVEVPSDISEFYTLTYTGAGASLATSPNLPIHIDDELREAFKRVFS